MRCRPASRPPAGDDGFVLLESVVAISLITVIMTAMATFFVGALDETNVQRSRQVAAQIANSGVEAIRGLPPSDLLTGHDATSVTTQYAAAPSSVSPWLASMTPATSTTATAGAGATAAIPTVSVTQTVNNVAYGLQSYLGTCGVINASGDCTIAGQATGTVYLRAVVAVAWRDKVCPSSLCTYVTATLVDQDDDPTFNLNQTPPAVPVIINPGPQTAAVGDAVALQLAVQAGTGVSPLTWAITAGSLPAGLAMSPAGLMSGVPTTTTSAIPVTVTVTDAFQRTASATFTWTIVPRLTIAAVADQASLLNTAVTPVTLTASGGNASPYSWTDPGNTLPPGLTLSAATGRITGSPTAVGTYAVRITATDSTATHSATVSFTWNVTYPPLAATNPGTKVSTVNQAIATVQLSASGGSGSYVWSGGASLPAGLTLSTSGAITGTPTSVGGTSVTLTVTDVQAGSRQSVTFTWNVVARPTVTAPAAQTHTVGATISVQLSSSCPNSPCSYALNNGPATLSINSNGVLSGTITSSAQIFRSVTVTITDASGATATSSVFTFTVNAAPGVTNPGTQTVTKATYDSLDASTLVSGGTGPFTYSATNLPSWLSINSSTGLISGTSPSPATADTVYSNILITATDSDGVSATSTPFKWIVSTLALAFGNQVDRYLSGSISRSLDNASPFTGVSYISGGSGAYTISVTGTLPSWLTYNATSHVFTVNTNAGITSATGITITVSDANGASVTQTISWTLTTLAWRAIQSQSTGQGRTATALPLASYLTNQPPAYYYSANLPAGLVLNNTTGVISGTVSATAPRGAYTVTVYALYSTYDVNSGAYVQTTFTWTVT